MDESFPGAEVAVSNEASQCPKRQADSVSCGVIVTQDIREIIAHGQIVGKGPYENTALAVRQEHTRLVGDKNSAFTERQAAVIEILTQGSLDSREQLEQQAAFHDGQHKYYTRLATELQEKESMKAAVSIAAEGKPLEKPAKSVIVISVDISQLIIPAAKPDDSLKKSFD